MKNGIARSGNDVVDAYIRCASMIMRSVPPIQYMVAGGQGEADGDRNPDNHKSHETAEDGDDHHEHIQRDGVRPKARRAGNSFISFRDASTSFSHSLQAASPT